MLTFLLFVAIFAAVLWFLLKDHRKHFPKWYGREFERPEAWHRY